MKDLEVVPTSMIDIVVLPLVPSMGIYCLQPITPIAMLLWIIYLLDLLEV